MKYSYNWLQKHIGETLPAPEVLKEKIIFHAFEVESFDTIKIGEVEDSIFDIKVLPDRAGDCLSQYGVAREIAGLLNLTLKPHSVEALPKMPLLLPVEVKSDACRRYIAIRIDGVAVGPSPLWLRHALESVGQRSINNVVDATNYILYDLGQPTHVYDAAKIDGGILVRAAHEGETIITLSEETKSLTSDALVIADYLGALAIAGIKGGKTAEVVDTTTSLILEIANFDPVSTRRTARTLALATDAAKRFENNLAPDSASIAAAQLTALIKDIAGGEVTGVSDTYPHPQELRTISFTAHDVAKLLGEWVTPETISTVFDQYHYEYTFDQDLCTLVVPYFRADLTGAHDITEEIGRCVGYDQIAPVALPTRFPIVHSSIYLAIRAVKAWLVHDGYVEVMTYSFQKKGQVEIMYGSKNKSALRSNLSESLKESFELNRINAPVFGAVEVKLFEIGTVFFNDHEEIHVATIEKGSVTEITLEAYIAEHAIVVAGTSLELPAYEKSFTMWSVYPYITRDVAVWVANDDDRELLVRIVSAFATEYCSRPAVLFDQFTKDGKTSMAYRFVFQVLDRTLTEAEVGQWFQILIDRIVDEKIFTIR